MDFAGPARSPHSRSENSSARCLIKHGHAAKSACAISISTFEEHIAYTTLMTTLDRLYKKHLLDRRKKGRAFLYLPAVTPEEFEHGIREDVIDGLLAATDAVQPVLACIVDAVSERDRELLDELERLVNEKKREIEQKSS